MSNQQRAGYYADQPKGYKAFIPAALPPISPVEITGELQELLSKADQALGRLDGSIHTLPDENNFVFMYVRKEAVLSNRIEGIRSSLHDVLAAEAQVFLPHSSGQDVDEVIRYIEAMNYGIKRLENVSISVELIRGIHKRLLREVRGSQYNPGEIRTIQNWIGPKDCKLFEADFVPPPPELVEEKLLELEQFIQGDSKLPLLIKIGLIHAQFETIHPFVDGNGRLGRLLITLLLCKHRILLHPVLYLSNFLNQNRDEYYEKLQSIREASTWEKWLCFFLRGVTEVSEQATVTARDILTLRIEHQALLTKNLGRIVGNGHIVLNHLYAHPIISVNDVKELLGTSTPAATNLIGGMVDCGILQEYTNRTRNRKYIYHEYVELFETKHAAMKNAFE